MLAGTAPWAWALFLGFIVFLLVLDLGLLHRKAHVISLKEAAGWSVVWVSLALAFNLLIWYWKGPTAALEFLTGYLVEESLSVDNLFVFLVVFKYFALPPARYHTVLAWGILGAIVLRGVMILAGAALLSRFSWVMYVFGALLVVTGIRLAFDKGTEVHPERNLAVRIARRFWPVTPRYVAGEFFVRLRNGRLAMTPLFLVVLVVETTDVLFAVDSIPAIFAITRDPFIVFTSNIFAILGLRSIFFLLAGIIHAFRFLKFGLAAVLALIGVKMLLESWVHVPVLVSLGAVGAILSASIAASMLIPAPPPERRGRS